MKDQRFHRTKQKCWQFYSGKGPQLAALETVFDLTDSIIKAHYKETIWHKPIRAELSEALDMLLSAA